MLDTDEEVEPELDVLPAGVDSEPLLDVEDSLGSLVEALGSVITFGVDSPLAPVTVVRLRSGVPDGVEALGSGDPPSVVSSPPVPVGVDALESVGPTDVD